MRSSKLSTVLKLEKTTTNSPLSKFFPALFLHSGPSHFFSLLSLPFLFSSLHPIIPHSFFFFLFFFFILSFCDTPPLSSDNSDNSSGPGDLCLWSEARTPELYLDMDQNRFLQQLQVILNRKLDDPLC